MRVPSVVAKSLFLKAAFNSSMILRKIPHFIEIDRKQLSPCLGIKSPLNSGIRYLSVASVENTFLSGMQSSESSFIVTSAVSSTEDRSENHESSIL